LIHRIRDSQTANLTCPTDVFQLTTHFSLDTLFFYQTSPDEPKILEWFQSLTNFGSNFLCLCLCCSRQDQGKSLLKGTRHFNQDTPPIFNGRVWKQGGSTRGKFEGEGVRSPLSTTRHAKQCGCEVSSYTISLKEQCCKTSFFHKRHTAGHALRCQLAPDLMGV